MKKQLIAIGLASVLTAPSVALAQEEEAAAAEEMAVEEMAVEEMAVEEMAVEEMAAATEAPAGPSVTVYGSFRTGLEFTSGAGAGDAEVVDVYSRFGIKGSGEVSEGLTASFLLENAFDTATGSLGDGRYGVVGLSGGFGSIVLGQTDTASANHFGYVVNPTVSYGVGGGAPSRAARMVSYSSSVGAVGFQIDRSTDAGAATVQFGASASAGPVNVGFAYWGKEDSPDTVVTTEATTTTTITSTTTFANVGYTVVEKGVDVDQTGGTLTVATTGDGTTTTTLTRKAKSGDVDKDGKAIPLTNAANDNKPTQVTVDGATIKYPLKYSNATEAKVAVDKIITPATKKPTPNPKTSFTGFYVSSSLAGMNLTVGVGSEDHGLIDDVTTTEVDESQTDVSIVALKGAVGDSGVSYVVQMSDSDSVYMLDKNGKPSTTVIDPSQTVVSLTSALGGGASLIFEHASYKSKADKSFVALRVDF